MTTRGLLWILGAAGILLALLAAAAAQTSTPATKPLFTEAPDSPFRVGIQPIRVAVGDFNGDGKLDLAALNYGPSPGQGSVTVLLGNGRGGFTEAPGSPFRAGSMPESLAVGDFNGDGKSDLAITDFAGYVTVLLGSGGGGLTEAHRSPFPVGRTAESVAVGDFNGDGKLDLAVALADDTVAVLLGDGKAGLAMAPGSPLRMASGSPSSVRSVAVGDFNGDGRLDLAIAHMYSGRITVLLGDGKGGFAEAPGSPVQAGSDTLAAGDFNGDGKLDLATPSLVVSKHGVVSKGGIVTVLLGDGKGGFAEAPGSPVQAGSQVGDVAAADFNRNGKADLAIISDGVRVLLGNGAGGFTEAPGGPFPVGIEPKALAVGDFNGDGKPDIAIVNHTSHSVTVLLNNSPGPATPAAAKPQLKPPAPGR